MADDPASTGPASTGLAKGKPAAGASKPFCSERCRDVDLNRWLSGAYAIPARDGDEEDPE